MYEVVRANSKEQLEDEILVLEVFRDGMVVEKPHTLDDKTWFATVDVPRSTRIWK